MNIKKVTKFISTAALIFLPLAAVAYLDTDVYGESPVSSVDQVIGVLRYVRNIIWAVFAILAVIFVIWAAFTYLTSAGDPEKVKKAQSQLIYAAVAVGVALIAAGINTIVKSFLETGALN